MRILGLIAGLALAASTLAVPARAFETTSVSGNNPDGTAHYQDPDDIKAANQLGSSQLGETGLQFGVKGSGFSDNSSDTDSGAPPWQLKPPPPSVGFYGSPYSSPFAR